MCSGQLHGRGIGGGSILSEFDLVRSLDNTEYRLGTFDLDRAGAHEIRSELKLAPHRLKDGRISVPERHRPQAHSVLDELVALQIPNMGAAPTFDERRRGHGELVVPLRVGV